MSGICGVWAFDGGDPDLGPVLAQLERRGPDGTRQWRDGPVALGHTLLATTPEGLVEQLPLTDQASGCTITADARLDNRDELIATLDLNGETRTIGDGELILRAYLAWGEDCPKHLLGDFAFAIWDPREQRLFCARDHMGMRQLIYHHAPGRLFAFATEADALVAHVDVPKRINDGRIADYLDNLEGLDLTSTFFEGLHRLPPAHVLVVTNETVTVRPYWRLRPPPELKLGSDKAYDQAFLEIFTKAVQCRLRNAGPVGVLLSGGIDSNAVVAVAAPLLAAEHKGSLRTYSGIGPDAGECAETRAIKAAIRRADLTATLIDYSRLGGTLDELVRMAKECAEPFDAPMTLHRAAYLEARRDGTKIVLDGVGGDLVLEPGNVVAELIAKGQLTEALRESAWRKRSFRGGVAAARQFIASIRALAMPKAIRHLRRRLDWGLDDRLALAGRTLINPLLVRSADLPQRRKQFRNHITTGIPFGPDYRVDAITHPHLIVGRERYDRVASALGIEPRDPFLDLRLISFCLSLPLEQLHRGRYTKAILRRAMDGIVPAEAIWRRGKEHVGWQFTQQLLPWLDPETACDQQMLGRYVNLRDSRRLNRNAGRPIDRLRWYEICVLSCWLARNIPSEQPFADQGE
ncbi:MAG: asparagine synthase-related protein [Sphingomicrobium sp.]